MVLGSLDRIALRCSPIAHQVSIGPRAEYMYSVGHKPGIREDDERDREGKGEVEVEVSYSVENEMP